MVPREAVMHNIYFVIVDPQLYRAKVGEMSLLRFPKVF